MFFSFSVYIEFYNMTRRAEAHTWFFVPRIKGEGTVYEIRKLARMEGYEVLCGST